MKRSNHSPLYTLALTTLAVVGMLALLVIIGAPRAGAAAPASHSISAAPAHESETPEATETHHPEGTQTPEATETHHPEGTQSPEPSETHHPEGTQSPEPSETHHPEGTQSPEPSETHHPEGTQSPEPSETQHPEGTQTASPEATHTARPETTRTLSLDPRLRFDNVQPGDTRSFDFDLRNRGTTADQITLGVASQLGWTVAVSPDSVLLDPNAHATVHVTVHVPGSANDNLDVETLTATDGTSTATSFVVLLTAEHGFSDLHPQDWSWNPVQFLATQSVVSGYGDGTFRPNNTVTRAQFAKMLVSGMGWGLVQPARPSFSDVPAGNWAFAYVETAVQHGALAGYADGTFRPYTNITRGQLAKLIVSARGWALVQPTQPSFSDVPTTYWAYGFIETTVDSGVLGGYADGTFRPAAPATRAQVAKILANGLILSQH